MKIGEPLHSTSFVDCTKPEANHLVPSDKVTRQFNRPVIEYSMKLTLTFQNAIDPFHKWLSRAEKRKALRHSPVNGNVGAGARGLK